MTRSTPRRTCRKSTTTTSRWSKKQSRPKRRRSWRSEVPDDLLGQLKVNGAVPRHVAIIMDGNGRWARERRLPRPLGHRAGMTSVREAVEGAIEAGVEVLTLFAFSEENWQRPPSEISALMGLLEEYIAKEIEELPGPGGQGRLVGDRGRP